MFWVLVWANNTHVLKRALTSPCVFWTHSSILNFCNNFKAPLIITTNFKTHLSISHLILLFLRGVVSAGSFVLFLEDQRADRLFSNNTTRWLAHWILTLIFRVTFLVAGHTQIPWFSSFNIAAADLWGPLAKQSKIAVHHLGMMSSPSPVRLNFLPPSGFISKFCIKVL